MNCLQEYIRAGIKTIRSNILSLAVQNPFLGLTLVIIICCAILPLVSATALMPLVAMVYIGDYLESKGLLSVIYITCFQGILLLLVLIILFTTAFMIATAANVIYSKYYPTSESKTLNVTPTSQKNATFALS